MYDARSHDTYATYSLVVRRLSVNVRPTPMCEKWLDLIQYHLFSCSFYMPVLSPRRAANEHTSIQTPQRASSLIWYKPAWVTWLRNECGAGGQSVSRIMARGLLPFIMLKGTYLDHHPQIALFSASMRNKQLDLLKQTCGLWDSAHRWKYRRDWRDCLGEEFYIFQCLHFSMINLLPEHNLKHTQLHWSIFNGKPAGKCIS